MFNKFKFFILILWLGSLLTACSAPSALVEDPAPPPAAPPTMLMEDHQAHEHHAPAATPQEVKPYTVVVNALTPLAKNQSSQLEIKVLNTKQQPVKHEQFQVLHGQRVHTLILDPSLVDYQHVHLRPDDGKTQAVYHIDFTPHRSGAYKFYLDVVDQKNQHYYLEATVNVPGKAQTPKLDPNLPKGSIQPKAQAGHLDFYAQTNRLIRANQETILEVTVKQGDLLFRKLEPTMQAYAHLVGFSADRSQLIHVHPLGEEPRSSNQRGGPNLKFGLMFPRPGLYRMFLQVRVDGNDLFVPLDVNVL